MTAGSGDDVVLRFGIDTTAAERDAAAAGDRGGQGFVGGLVSSFGGSRSAGIGGLAVAAGAAFAAVGAAAGAAFAIGAAGAIEQESSNDKLAAQLGLTESESATYGEIAGRLYADAYGESFGEVNDAIGAVRSSIGEMANASAAELEGVTAKALDFASAFEVDVARSSQVAGQLISTGLAKDANEAFDLITAASQRVPAALREDILDAGDEYGQFFATLGFSGEEAFAVLVDGAEKGMFGIDKAGDAIKEFTIRATDMSTATQEALGGLGLDAEKMANDILAGGDRASGAFDDILTAFNEMPDGADKANAAIALFGTPLEDLSTAGIPEFINSLSSGSDALEGFEGASERMGDTLNDNASTRITAFKRTLEQGLVNFVGGQVLPVLSEFSDLVADRVGPVVSDLGGIFDRDVSPKLGAYVGLIRTEVLPVLGEFGAYITDEIVPRIVELGEYFAEHLQPVFAAAAEYITEDLVPALQDIAGWIIDEVVPAVVTLVENVAENLAPVFETATEVIAERLIPALSEVVAWFRDELVPALEPVLERVWGFVEGGIELASVIIGTVLPPLIEFGAWLLETFGPIIGDIVIFVIDLVDWFGSIGDKAREVGGDLLQFGEDIIDGVMEAVGNVWDAISSLPEDIAGLAGDMLGAGLEMMGGFVDGLMGIAESAGDIAGAVWEAFKGFINDFVIDPLNGILTYSIDFGIGSVQLFDDPPIPRLARGTRGNAFPGGYAWVGEEGPELTYLQPGAEVIPADESQRMAGAGIGGTYIGTVVAHDYDDFLRQVNDENRQAAMGGPRPITAGGR